MASIDVTKTKIYKRILPCIRKQDRREFRRMLQMVADCDASLSTDAETLGYAFVWCDTPQGHDYWRELCGRLGDAGYSVGAGWSNWGKP